MALRHATALAILPLLFMMQEPSHSITNQRLLIRIGHSSLSLLTYDGHQVSHYAEAEMRSGMSVAANLRDWIKSQPLLTDRASDVTILLQTPNLLVPSDEFGTDEAAVLYRYTFSGHDHDRVDHIVLPDHHAVVVFGIDKDLGTVVTDHFGNCQWQPVCLSVWQRMGKRGSHDREHQRLHVYFHDGLADVFSFSGSHFKFCNAFTASHANDTLYYILNAFTQQGMRSTRDEVMILGQVSNKKWLVQQLESYVGRVIVPEQTAIQPDTSQWPSMPTDLIYAISK